MKGSGQVMEWLWGIANIKKWTWLQDWWTNDLQNADSCTWKKIIFRKFVLGHYRAAICKKDWQCPLSVFHTDLAAKLVETRPDTQLPCGWAGATFEVTRPFRQGQWGQRNEIIKKSKIGTNRPTDRWTKVVVESLARDKKRGGKQEEGSLSLNHP